MPAGSLVDRVFDVVELLADFPEGLALSDISRSLRMSKSEAHRLLGIFVARGFATQDEASRRYRLTVRFAVIGYRYFGKAGLVDLCQPVLDRLAARTGELARLAVLEAGALTFVANAQGAQTGVRYDEELGRAIAAPQATANGRVWLASLEEDRAIAIVKAQGFILPPGYVRSVVTDEASLRLELRRTREQGYGVSLEEWIQGIATVAVAIRRRTSEEVVGVVSVSAPAFRLTEAGCHAVAPVVADAARELAEIWPLPRTAPTPPAAAAAG